MQNGNASFMGGDCTPPKSNKPPSATHFGGGSNLSSALFNDSFDPSYTTKVLA